MEQLTTGRISLRRTGTYAGAPVAGFVTALHKGELKVYKGFPHGMLTTHADVINADMLAFIRK